MPIDARWRLPSSGTEIPSSGTEVRYAIPGRHQKVLRGGQIVRLIDHVLRQISIGWNDLPLRANEDPVVLKVFLDSKPSFVHQWMMTRAKRHKIVDAGLAAVGPMLNVMNVQEATVTATRKSTAMIVAHDSGEL